MDSIKLFAVGSLLPNEKNEAGQSNDSPIKRLLKASRMADRRGFMRRRSRYLITIRRRCWNPRMAGL